MSIKYSKEGYYRYKEENPIKKRKIKICIIAGIIVGFALLVVGFFAFFVNNPSVDVDQYKKNDIDEISEEIKDNIFDASKYYN